MAQHRAIVQPGQVVWRQALIMGFPDTFAVVGVILVIAALLLLMVRKPRNAASAGSAH